MRNSERCHANTKKHGTQCTNMDAEWNPFTKQMLCHLHHPDRKYRQQVHAKRGERITDPQKRPANGLSIRKAGLPSMNVTHHGPGISVPGRQLDEDRPKDGARYFGIDRPCTISPTAGLADPISTSRRRE